MKIELREKDVITIQFTLREVIKESGASECFVKQTKSLLGRFESAMAKAGFKDAKTHKF